MQPLPSVAVVIPASGVGKRMNSAIPKQYITLSNQTILEHTVSHFLALPFVVEVIIVVSEQDDYIHQQNFIGHEKVTLTLGGNERGNSVYNGLHKISEQIKWVMVHDAARPCIKPQDSISLLEYSVKQDRSAILVTPVRDTMKRIDEGKITGTVDRQCLFHALTPQCCKVSDLKYALSKLIDDNSVLDRRVTDEASALELCGFEVDAVIGSQTNIKVTQAEDLALAEFYLRSEG